MGLYVNQRNHLEAQAKMKEPFGTVSRTLLVKLLILSALQLLTFACLNWVRRHVLQTQGWFQLLRTQTPELHYPLLDQ